MTLCEYMCELRMLPWTAMNHHRSHSGVCMRDPREPMRDRLPVRKITMECVARIRMRLRLSQRHRNGRERKNCFCGSGNERLREELSDLHCSNGEFNLNHIEKIGDLQRTNLSKSAMGEWQALDVPGSA